MSPEPREIGMVSPEPVSCFDVKPIHNAAIG